MSRGYPTYIRDLCCVLIYWGFQATQEGEFLIKCTISNEFIAIAIDSNPIRNPVPSQRQFTQIVVIVGVKDLSKFNDEGQTKYKRL